MIHFWKVTILLGLFFWCLDYIFGRSIRRLAWNLIICLQYPRIRLSSPTRYHEPESLLFICLRLCRLLTQWVFLKFFPKLKKMKEIYLILFKKLFVVNRCSKLQFGEEFQVHFQESLLPWWQFLELFCLIHMTAADICLQCAWVLNLM